MNDRISNKLSQLLSGMDAEKLKSSAGAVSKLLSSSEGQKLKNSLSEKDKKEILERFMNMDTKKAEELLKKTDAKAIEKLSVDDILKKLR